MLTAGETRKIARQVICCIGNMALQSSSTSFATDSVCEFKPTTTAG